MTLRTRKPTNIPSWPLILLAGDAKTGKTYRAAEFTGDERVGRAFWLDLGEGCADEYGAVPGADYEIIDHDGTWADIIGQVSEVRDIARKALADGEKPVVLVIDSMTAEWAMLSAWTDTRARRSTNNKKLLAANADAEIDITANYWNDANSRHNRLMNILKTFPGIVVMTSLETEKTQFGPNGKPVQNAPKVAKPDAQKRLTADATAWIRLSLDNDPVVVGIRSLRHNITPGQDKPEPWEGFTLAKLVFEFLGISPETAQVRDTPVLDADQVMPEEASSAEGQGTPAARQGSAFEKPQPDEDTLLAVAQLLTDAATKATRDDFKPLWKEAKDKGWMGLAVTRPGGTEKNTVQHHLEQDVRRIDQIATASQPATQSQKNQVFALLDDIDKIVSADLGDRDNRLRLFSALLGSPVSSANDLTSADAEVLARELRNLPAGAATDGLVKALLFNAAKPAAANGAEMAA